MKTNRLFMMVTTMILSLVFNSTWGQNSYDAFELIDTGNIRAVINSNGILFENLPDLDYGFEAPKDGGVHATFAGDLWIGGMDEDGQLHIAASTYRQLGDDFFPGPIDITGNGGDIATWDKLWKTGKTEIEFHKIHFADAGYVVPQSIAEWPGNGPTGFDQIMAPFADLNNNGIYEPALGDYPQINGDQAVYFIYNDVKLPHTETNGSALGIEVHGMAYEFSNDNNPALANSLFFNYTLKNKSLNNYHDVYLGLWNDYDLGCFSDDYVGTDVAKNSIFVINADSIDGGVVCNDGYGLNPPALATTFLSHPLTHSIGYRNDYTVMGNPSDLIQGYPMYYYNYLHSTWLDGSPMAVDSLHPGGYGGTELVNYYFPGVSDSSVYGQPSNWWWDSLPAPIDMRMIGSTGPLDLPSQGVISFDCAYIFNPHNGGDNNGAGRLSLSNAIQTIIDLYDSGEISSAPLPEGPKLSIEVSPNPFHDYTTIRFSGDAPIERMELADLSGRVFLSLQIHHESEIIIQRNHLSAGVYLLRLSSDQQRYMRKIVVQ